MENFLKIFVLLTTAWHVVHCCPGMCACLPTPGGGAQAICVGAGLTSIPEGFWPFTTHLFLSDNKISVINASDFLNLGDLVTLDLSSNVIEVIDKTAFHPLTKLTYLNLQSNKISSLETAHFQTLAKLETLYIGSNSDIDLYGPCTLSTLVNMKKLSLTYSPITFGLYLFGNSTSCNEYHCNTLTDSSMCHLPVLDELDISYTATDKVPAELFGLTPNLRILSLAGNNLKEIPDGSFLDLVGLKELTLNYNNLTYVNRGTFNGTTNLMKLELGNDGLVVDPDVFDDMPNLSELSLTLLGQSVIDSLASIVGNTNISKLNLHHNFLTSIPVSMSHISTLTSLDLSQNLITHLPGREFTTSLTELDLSKNDIASLDGEAFLDLTLLNTLSLCNNRLDTVSYLVFASLPSSAKICLGNNPWICDCEMKDIIADERHDTFPYPICSSPTELQGRPFSSISGTDICPVTTVTDASPTTKQTTTKTVTKSSTTPASTFKSPETNTPTPTNQSPSTRVTRIPQTKPSTSSTTILTVSTSSSTISTTNPTTTKPKRSTVRTLPHTTDKFSTTTLVLVGTTDNTVSTVILVTVFILIPAVIVLSILVICLYVKTPRKANQIRTTTNSHSWEGGSGHNGSVEPPQLNPGLNPPPIYEEIPHTYPPHTEMNNHFYLDGQNSCLLSNPSPVATSEPLKNPDVSVIFSAGACNIPTYQSPPPPYLEICEDPNPAGLYDTSIVNEDPKNHYDTKISQL